MTQQRALVLIVEDESDIADVLQRYLERESLRSSVALDGHQALVAHQQLKPDLVLLDVKLPKRDGFEVLAEIRRRGTTPVIILSAMTEDSDKISALRIGADDYVTKPFNPVEIVARTKAVLRRTASPLSQPAMITAGPVRLDLEARTVVVTGQDQENDVTLTTAEFRIVEILARSPRRIFARHELLDAISLDSAASERVVDSHISHIRRKLAQAGASPVIESLRGVGYRFETLK